MSLRITVDFLPSGDAKRAEKIGEIVLENRSDMAPISDYRVIAKSFLSGRKVEWETVVSGVEKFARRMGWAYLVRDALDAVLARDFKFAHFHQADETQHE